MIIIIIIIKKLLQELRELESMFKHKNVNY